MTWQEGRGWVWNLDTPQKWFMNDLWTAPNWSPKCANHKKFLEKENWHPKISKIAFFREFRAAFKRILCNFFCQTKWKNSTSKWLLSAGANSENFWLSCLCRQRKPTKDKVLLLKLLLLWEYLIFHQTCQICIFALSHFLQASTNISVFVKHVLFQKCAESKW